MPRPSSHVLVIAALTACTAPPPPVAGSSPAPAPSSVAPKAPLAVDDQTLHDLSLIVGGNFSPDHMGPEAYDAIVARYRAAPGKYLEALLARYARTDPNPALHGDSFIAWFLEQLHPSDPAGTERAAKVFHDLWGQAMADPSLDPRVRLQLEEQLATVTVLAGGIDRPFSPAWVATTADRICASSVPEGHGVTLQNDCTCGQPMACHAELGGRSGAGRLPRLLPDLDHLPRAPALARAIARGLREWPGPRDLHRQRRRLAARHHLPLEPARKRLAQTRTTAYHPAGEGTVSESPGAKRLSRPPRAVAKGGADRLRRSALPLEPRPAVRRSPSAVLAQPSLAT